MTTQLIEQILGGLKHIQSNNEMKQNLITPLNNQLSLAGLDAQEKRVIIGFCIHAESADSIAKGLSVTKDVVSMLYESATKKLSSFAPLLPFIGKFKEYQDNLPR